MAGQRANDTHIKCTRCNVEYHKTDEDIKDNFGYNRLGEPFKTCLNCREKKRGYNRQWYKQRYETNRDEELERQRIYREQHKEERQEKSQEIVECDVCGVSIRKWGLARHQRTTKCNKAI